MIMVKSISSVASSPEGQTNKSTSRIQRSSEKVPRDLNEVVRLKDQLREAKERILQFRNDAASREVEINDLKRDVEKLLSDNRKLYQSSKEFLGDVASFKKQNRQLKKKLAALEEEKVTWSSQKSFPTPNEGTNTQKSVSSGFDSIHFVETDELSNSALNETRKKFEASLKEKEDLEVTVEQLSEELEIMRDEMHTVLAQKQAAESELIRLKQLNHLSLNNEQSEPAKHDGHEQAQVSHCKADAEEDKPTQLSQAVHQPSNLLCCCSCHNWYSKIDTRKVFKETVHIGLTMPEQSAYLDQMNRQGWDGTLENGSSEFAQAQKCAGSNRQHNIKNGFLVESECMPPPKRRHSFPRPIFSEETSIYQAKTLHSLRSAASSTVNSTETEAVQISSANDIPIDYREDPMPTNLIERIPWNMRHSRWGRAFFAQPDSQRRFSRASLVSQHSESMSTSETKFSVASQSSEHTSQPCSGRENQPWNHLWENPPRNPNEIP